MRSRSKTTMAWMSCVVLSLLGGQVASGPVPPGDAVGIQLSPNVLVLEAPVTWLTVHTNLPLSAVHPSSVALNGLPADVVKADACGDLVAKFHMEAVEAIVSPPEATLTLTGLKTDGTSFAASDTIRVIGAKKK